MIAASIEQADTVSRSYQYETQKILREAIKVERVKAIEYKQDLIIAFKEALLFSNSL